MTAPAAATDLLPDLITRAADLYDHQIVTHIIPGRIHLAHSNGTANIGSGELRLVGADQIPGTEKREVFQRITDSDGATRDRLAGAFIFHPTHDHVHFENWTVYRLREVTANDGVGAILAESDKTSFCLVDFEVYDATLPNYPAGGVFHKCDQLIQGLSVGWIDIYTKELPGQQIDVSSLPEGVYWLESIVDPDNLILEGDESNNTARIKVTIGAPAGLAPDKFEDNNTALAITARNLGGPNSPNLGPCAPLRTIENLSVSDYQDVDYFRFYLNSTAGSEDELRIDFHHADGDLDLELFNSSQVRLHRANGVSDSEIVSLDGYPAGWYFARVYGYNGAINPQYSLTVNPPENAAPVVTALSPSIDDTLVHGLDMFRVSWEFSDPEDDSCWALVYANTAPAFDGSETLVSRSGYVPAALGGYTVNSAHLQVATYWFYVLVTDGGSVSGTWSDGTVTFTSSLSCPAGDANGSGSIDIGDVTFLVDYIFRGGAPPELSAGDANADSLINIADLTYLVARIFANGPAPVCP